MMKLKYNYNDDMNFKIFFPEINETNVPKRNRERKKRKTYHSFK